MDNVLASRPVAPGSILGVPRSFSLEIDDIILTALLRTLDRGLTMSIEPI